MEQKVFAANAYCNSKTKDPTLQKEYDTYLGAEPIITQRLKAMLSHLNAEKSAIDDKAHGVKHVDGLDTEHYMIVNAGSVVKTAPDFEKSFPHSLQNGVINYTIVVGEKEFSDMVQRFIDTNSDRGNDMINMHNYFLDKNPDKPFEKGVECAFMSQTGIPYTVRFATTDAIFAERQAQKMLHSGVPIEKCFEITDKVPTPDGALDFQEFSVGQDLYNEIKDRCTMVDIEVSREHNYAGYDQLETHAFLLNADGERALDSYGNEIDMANLVCATNEHDSSIVVGISQTDNEGLCYETSAIGSMDDVSAMRVESFEVSIGDKKYEIADILAAIEESKSHGFEVAEEIEEDHNYIF